MQQSLRDQQILVIREEKQAQLFSNKIRERGGIPIEVPLLKINCKQVEDHEQIMALLADSEWLFFTSANGVHCFFTMISNIESGDELIERCRIAVVGHKTAAALKEHGHEADLIPTIYKATVLAEEFLIKYPEAERLVLIRGSLAREELFNYLKRHGLSVRVMEVYETVLNYQAHSELNLQLEQNSFDYLTFTSPSTVEVFIHMIHEQKYLHIPAVCIGPTTKKSAEKCGFINVFTPSQFTIEGMVERMGKDR